MKKYLWIVALIAALAMVFVGCKNDPEPEDKPTTDAVLYTITFDANAADGGTAPKAIEQASEGAEITLPANTGNLVKDLFDFDGWNTKATGLGIKYPAGEKIKPAADMKLYANWLAQVPFTITFNLNGGGGTVPLPIKQSEPNQAITLPGQGKMTPPNPGDIFAGWGKTTAGADAAGNAVYKPMDDETLFAIWVNVTPSGPDAAKIEKVSLPNAWYAVYRFEIPNGKKYSDYKGISASYMFLADDLEVATERNGRLMGNYLPTDFTLVTGSSSGTANGKKLAVANYNGGKNNPYIMDQGKLGNSGTAGSLKDALKEKAGIDALGGKWFTITYDSAGGNPSSGNFSAANNLPAGADTGTLFYYGIGLPGAGASDTNTHYIKDVKLLGYKAEDDLDGIPVVFKSGSDNYPAFTGYALADGSNGYSAASRAYTVATNTYTPVDITPTAIEITFDRNVPSAETDTTTVPAANIVLDTTEAKAKTYSTLGANFPLNFKHATLGMLGWNTKADGSGRPVTKDSPILPGGFLSSNAVASVTTVYAQWATGITITQKANYGASDPDINDQPADVAIVIGTGAALNVDDLAALTRDGYVFLGWYTTASDTPNAGSKVTNSTAFTATGNIYARWVLAATTDKPIDTFSMTLDNAGGDQLTASNGKMAILTGNKIDLKDLYDTNHARRNGVDQIRFSVVFDTPTDYLKYESIDVAFEVLYTDPYPVSSKAVVKTQAFYGKNNTTNTINFFDFVKAGEKTGTEVVSPVSFPILVSTPVDATVAVPSAMDGLCFKLNPYGVASGYTMEAATLSIEIKSVTLKAYAP